MTKIQNFFSKLNFELTFKNANFDINNFVDIRKCEKNLTFMNVNCEQNFFKKADLVNWIFENPSLATQSRTLDAACSNPLHKTPSKEHQLSNNSSSEG